MLRAVTAGEDTPGARRALSQSVVRAFDVLAVLRDAPRPLSAREAADCTGLDRTVVHRLLRTLVAHGMAVEADGRFELGPEAVRLGNAYLDRLLVRRVAVPHLVELQTRVLAERPWTVSLSVATGDVTTVVERIWNPGAPLALVLDVGDTFAIDRSAAGRALLAYAAPDELTGLLGAERAAALAPTLDEVRAAGGIGLTHGEARAGIDSVAAAVLTRAGRPAGAIAVAGSDLGAELAYASPLAAELRQTADVVGRALA
jgi:IclR family acetate operon transcriptional repressor